MENKTEKKAQHTPGPWRLAEGSNRRIFIPSDTIEVIASRGMIACLYRENWNSGMDEANAQLIKAAPDLIEACKLAYERLKPPGKDVRKTYHELVAWAALGKAIFKAEGE